MSVLDGIATIAEQVVDSAGYIGLVAVMATESVLRASRRLGLTEARLARVESWSIRRGDWIVLLGRLVHGIRSAVSVPAGTLRMPMGRVLALTAIGSFGWNAALIGAGVLLADRWQAVLSALVGLAPYGLVAAAAALGLLLLVRRGRSLPVAP